MSDVPNTLEELQYAILQGDLQDNPYLQPHTIPARDKELKTKAKKIIPAINELVKLVETCKESVDAYSNQIEDKVQKVVAELEVTLKQEYAQEIDQRFEALEATINQLVTDEVTKQVSKIGSSSGGTETMKKKFISKATINTNSNGVKAPFKFTEIQNIQEQIVPIIKTTYKTTGYINVAKPYELNHTSSSVYAMYNYPLELRIDTETDEVTVVNQSSSAMMVYFFEME